MSHSIDELPGEAVAAPTLWSGLARALHRFLDALPDHYEDMDPSTGLRIPVPF